MIEGQEGVSWPEWQALAAACEEHGIPALFRSDHYLPLDGAHERRFTLDWLNVVVADEDDLGCLSQRGPKARVAEIPCVGHAPTLLHADQIALARDFLLQGEPS